MQPIAIRGVRIPRDYLHTVRLQVRQCATQSAILSSSLLSWVGWRAAASWAAMQQWDDQIGRFTSKNTLGMCTVASKLLGTVH